MDADTRRRAATAAIAIASGTLSGIHLYRYLIGQPEGGRRFPYLAQLFNLIPLALNVMGWFPRDRSTRAQADDRLVRRGMRAWRVFMLASVAGHFSSGVRDLLTVLAAKRT